MLKRQKIAALCMIIACLDDEGEGIRKKGPDGERAAVETNQHCFPSWLNRETYVSDAKMFLNTFFLNTIFVSEQQNWFPQHIFSARLNWETFAATTLFPQQCFQD